MQIFYKGITMKKTLLGISLSLSLALAWNTQEISGLQSPESVFATKDCIFVSNLGKEVKPLEKDNDGFIVKMDLNGKVLDKIDNLNAPKGMSIINGVLYASDIDEIKGFDLKTLKQVFSLPIKNAIFLNDLTTDGKNLYVSDTGSGTIYFVDVKKKNYSNFITLDSAKYGGGPNGLLLKGKDLWVVTYDPNGKMQGVVLKIALKNKNIQIFSETKGFLDGITEDEKGNLLVSSWGENLNGLVYQISPSQKVEKLPLRAIKGCADIFYAQKTLWIPAMLENKVLKITK